MRKMITGIAVVVALVVPTAALAHQPDWTSSQTQARNYCLSRYSPCVWYGSDSGATHSITHYYTTSGKKSCGYQRRAIAVDHYYKIIRDASVGCY
jgi:hypothetical protein